MWRVALIGLFACGGGSVHDAAVGDGLMPSCPEIRERFRTLVASIDVSCLRDGDCVVAGGANYEDQCDCFAYLPGYGVNAADYQGTEASDLEADFRKDCLDYCEPPYGCWCDTPAAEVGCGDGGQCEAYQPSCGCGWCTDAGVAGPPPIAASH